MGIVRFGVFGFKRLKDDNYMSTMERPSGRLAELRLYVINTKDRVNSMQLVLQLVVSPWHVTYTIIGM